MRKSWSDLFSVWVVKMGGYTLNRFECNMKSQLISQLPTQRLTVCRKKPWSWSVAWWIHQNVIWMELIEVEYCFGMHEFCMLVCVWCRCIVCWLNCDSYCHLECIWIALFSSLECFVHRELNRGEKNKMRSAACIWQTATRQCKRQTIRMEFIIYFPCILWMAFVHRNQ